MAIHILTLLNAVLEYFILIGWFHEWTLKHICMIAKLYISTYKLYFQVFNIHSPPTFSYQYKLKYLTVWVKMLTALHLFSSKNI